MLYLLLFLEFGNGAGEERQTPPMYLGQLDFETANKRVLVLRRFQNSQMPLEEKHQTPQLYCW
jgi:hypothetical protein